MAVSKTFGVMLVKPGMRVFLLNQIIFLTLWNLDFYTMAQHYPCETCKLRAHYEKNPKSFRGRFWRWHINFCPGFKAYFTHQDEETKAALREKYNFQKYK